MKISRVFLFSVMLIALSFSAQMAVAQSESDMVSEELSIIVEQNLNEGRQFYAEGKYESALEKFNAVLERNPNNGEAIEYKKLCEYKMDLDERFEEGVVSLTTVERERANSLYTQGKTLYDVQDLDGALNKFQQVIVVNPVHVPARRYIDYILMIKREMAERDKDLVESSRVLDVKKAWIPPQKSKSGTTDKVARGKIISPQMKLMQEKVSVVIKEINFTEAHLRDVLQYLSKVSGVNIILDEGIFNESGTISIPSEVSVRDGEDDPVVPATENISDRITISLKDIPLIAALKYILRTKGLEFRIDEFAIVVSTPLRIRERNMETRYYHLAAGTAAFSEFKVNITMGGGIETDDVGDDFGYDLSGDDDDSGMSDSGNPITIKDVFVQSGVPFSQGSSVFLDMRTSTLIVRNTPDSLTLVEEILERIDRPPFQIEIEAKFVQINQTAINELGFEWLLKSAIGINSGKYQIDSTNYDTTTGKYPFNDRARDDDYTNVVDGVLTSFPLNRGLTKGVRFFEGFDQPGYDDVLGASATPYYYGSENEQTDLGSILSFSGILTDPEFRVIMHALDQSGNANELSAPKVTTVNNQQAQIESVAELRYPGGFEVTPPVVSDAGVTPPVVTPVDFITRDVGIILNVTPSVGSDRRTINLTLIPEVSELIGWKDYGSTYDGYEIKIEQPIFRTRNVTTSVIINDGETIVLGGLMSEDTIKIRDKLPILGDIPIIGRLFKNEGEKTSKTNLLIFVTANLLDPSGNMIRDN
ncbi:MAG: hypothetical protein KAI43_00030 [Candidatus Aureabacteria bacterium]|nr:hypothetical protein [Candidatus Auribacterota bacterium]